MKKLIIAAAIAAASVAGAAYAGTIENAVGNTITVTTPDGAQVRYHFEADGTFTAHMADNSTVSGTWANQDENVCLTPEGGSAQCYPAGDYNVGDTWTLPGPDGSAGASLTMTGGR
ncbi:MAG: hypothetical protein AB7J28_03665 [Hyphomonadaceae bacterium]